MTERCCFTKVLVLCEYLLPSAAKEIVNTFVKTAAQHIFLFHAAKSCM